MVTRLERRGNGLQSLSSVWVGSTPSQVLTRHLQTLGLLLQTGG